MRVGVGATPFGKHDAGVVTSYLTSVKVLVVVLVADLVSVTVRTRHGVLVTDNVCVSVLVVVVVFFGGHGRVVKLTASAVVVTF